MTRLPVDVRHSTWLTVAPIVQPEPPVRDDPTTYTPSVRASERLARRLRNALIRGDRTAMLIVEGLIEREGRQ